MKMDLQRSFREPDKYADADGSGEPNAADIDYLIDYFFSGGPDPVPCP